VSLLGSLQAKEWNCFSEWQAWQMGYCLSTKKRAGGRRCIGAGPTVTLRTRQLFLRALSGRTRAVRPPAAHEVFGVSISINCTQMLSIAIKSYKYLKINKNIVNYCFCFG
jgi:hypothetical protein